MNVTRLRQARRLFASPYADTPTQRRNIRLWVRSLRNLGSRWLLHTPVRRPT